MTRVVLDSEDCRKLGHVQKSAEVCDESGRIIGHLLSGSLYKRIILDLGNAQISDEELMRRRALPGGKSLQDIWSGMVDHA